MEARRTLQGRASSSKQVLILVAALLVVWALGVAIVFFVTRTSSPSVPAAGHVMQTSSQAPDAQERNAQILSAQADSSGSPYLDTLGTTP